MKLVGYNIQYSRGRDGRYDLARVACAVDGADIIALQEVERFWPRTCMADQSAELSALLPDYYWVYGPSFDMDASTAQDGVVENRRRQFGNMLLARWPIVSSRLNVLPKMRTTDHFNMDMPALEAVVATESGPLRVWSIHLSSISSRERLLQIDYLRDLHARVPAGGGAWTGAPDIRGDESWSCGALEPPMPADAIWIGDFNAQPQRRHVIAGRVEFRVAHLNVLQRLEPSSAFAREAEDGQAEQPVEQEEQRPLDIVAEDQQRVDRLGIEPQVARRLGSA